MSASLPPSPLPEAGAQPVRRRGKTRPALMQAGLRLLARRSVDSLSIDEIVEAAGVAKGSFFYHFADKQSFAREIAAAVRVEVEETITEVNRDVQDPAQRVARGVGQFMRYALTEPDKATIVVTAARGSADPRNALNAGLRADLELGLRAGRFDCPDIDAAMLNLIGVTNLLIGKILFDRLAAQAARPLFCSVLAFAFRGLGLSAIEAQAVLSAVAAELLPDR